MDIKKEQKQQDNTEPSNVLYMLLGAVDWRGISKKDIIQIKYEVEHWYNDYSQLQKLLKLSGEDVGESFEDKFKRWIGDRIQMVLDRQ